MRHLILIVAIWWFGSPVESAEINVNAPDSHGRIFVDIVGQIAANDDKAFEQKTAIHTRYNKVIVTLSGPGGVALTAMKIGERIHTNGWGTYVPSGAVCASSCAIIWLAGVPRTIEGAPGVIIGFHAVYDIETQKESGAANAILGHYLTRWGLDDHGIACITITPPNEMGWLTGPNGRGCGIGWEVLTPARNVPIQLPPSRPTEPKQRVVYLSCTPTQLGKSPLSGGGASEFMTGEPDPVTDIAVGLKISSNESNAATQIEYFDAWHHTAKGNTYKRSEQYGDRSFNISKANEPIWLWQGRWIRDRNVFMIGQLAMTSRGSTYKEWILHGDPGPQNHGDEVTSSVCREVRQ